MLSKMVNIWTSLLCSFDRSVNAETIQKAREEGDAEKVKGLEMKLKETLEVEEAQRSIVDFVCKQMGISCVHPNMNPATWPAPTGPLPYKPLVNPLRMDFDELMQSDESIRTNYERFSNLVQIHRCKHAYCLREVKASEVSEGEPGVVKKDGKTYTCRFKFPQTTHGYNLQMETGNKGDFIKSVTFDPAFSRGAVIAVPPGQDRRLMVSEKRDLLIARNHPFVDPHVKEIGLGFGANTDAQLIKSFDQCQRYLTAYVGKKEPNSHDFQKVMKSSVSQLNEKSSIRSGLQRTMIKATTREICRQEAVIMLSKDIEFMHFSLPVRRVCIGGSKLIKLDVTNPNAKVTNDSGYQGVYWSREDDENYQDAIKKFESDPDGWKTEAQKYHPTYKDPVHPKSVSLHEFTAFFNKNWKFSTREHFPIFTPFFRVGVNANNEELYEVCCKNRLLQFKPGANQDNLLGDTFETYEDCLADFVENHSRCPNFLKEEFQFAQEKKAKKALAKKNKEGEVIEDNYDDLPDVEYEDLYPNVDGNYSLILFI